MCASCVQSRYGLGHAQGSEKLTEKETDMGYRPLISKFPSEACAATNSKPKMHVATNPDLGL